MKTTLQYFTNIIHEEEREIFLATEENTMSLKEFDEYFQNVETKQDLMEVLGRIGFDEDEAETRLERAILS